MSTTKEKHAEETVDEKVAVESSESNQAEAASTESATTETAADLEVVVDQEPLHLLEIEEFDQSSFELAFDTDQITIHAWCDSGPEAVTSRVAKIPLAESEEMIATARVVHFEHKRRAKAAKQLEKMIRKRVREASKMRIDPSLYNGK